MFCAILLLRHFFLCESHSFLWPAWPASSTIIYMSHYLGERIRCAAVHAEPTMAEKICNGVAVILPFKMAEKFVLAE